jgi:hypothetical protein
VTFGTLNVFGRTIGPQHTDGRDHNKNHQVSLAIGRGFRSSLIGGVTTVDGDYGCTSIDPQSGGIGGSIDPTSSLASWAQTFMVGCGVDESVVGQQITSGTIIRGALAS